MMNCEKYPGSKKLVKQRNNTAGWWDDETSLNMILLLWPVAKSAEIIYLNYIAARHGKPVDKHFIKKLGLSWSTQQLSHTEGNPSTMQLTNKWDSVTSRQTVSQRLEVL
jgi:hypothetical protein